MLEKRKTLDNRTTLQRENSKIAENTSCSIKGSRRKCKFPLFPAGDRFAGVWRLP
jgi:hypothetical protein